MYTKFLGISLFNSFDNHFIYSRKNILWSNQFLKMKNEFLKVKPQQTDAECPITGGSKDIYSERTNRYYAKQIQAIRKDE